MRINKYIAASGITSRRKADELIEQGKVLVNGKVLREPGYDVQPGDTVIADGREIEKQEKPVYYMLNKPIHVLTAVSDDRGRTTVCDLLTDVDERVFPVGRLDYNTSGMLFLTNDGRFAYKLTHPKHKVGKTYRVLIAGNIDKASLAALRKGVDIGGFITSPAEVNVEFWTKKSTVLTITIHEGKYHQVRKMFKAVGHPVQELARIKVGDMDLGRLKEGQYRKLSPREVEYLMSL